MAKRRDDEFEEEEFEEERPRRRRRDEEEELEEEEVAPRRRGGAAAAQQAINVPAIGLMATGILNVLLALFQMVRGVIQVISPPPVVIIGPGLKGGPAFEQSFVQSLTAGGGILGIILGIIALICSAVIILGALKMKNLQSFGLSLTSAILAMIPCFSPCCLLGLVFGIWGLVVMNKPEVKSAFH